MTFKVVDKKKNKYIYFEYFQSAVNIFWNTIFATGMRVLFSHKEQVDTNIPAKNFNWKCFMRGKSWCDKTYNIKVARMCHYKTTHLLLQVYTESIISFQTPICFGNRYTFCLLLYDILAIIVG